MADNPQSSKPNTIVNFGIYRLPFRYEFLARQDGIVVELLTRVLAGRTVNEASENISRAYIRLFVSCKVQSWQILDSSHPPVAVKISL